LAFLTFSRCRHTKRHSLSARITDFRRGFDLQTNELAWRLIHDEGASGSFGDGSGARGLSGFLKLFNRLTTDADHLTMAFSPFKFLQEVRTETNKVTWPSRRETTITTIMVFIMVALSSVFFFAADQIIRLLVTFLLGIR
jgi:preprotein translocase subunit SecE